MGKKRPKRTRVPISKIKAGPVRGELDDGDAIAVRYVHHYASELTGKSLEETELDFMREADPSQETALWLTMIGIARRYCEVHPMADYKAALTSMLHVSIGAEPPIKEIRSFADAFDRQVVIDYFEEWLDAQEE